MKALLIVISIWNWSLSKATNGIDHQFSIPTSQQNGVAERKHRHISEKGLLLWCSYSSIHNSEAGSV